MVRTPLEAEEILTYIKRPRNGSVCYFSSKLDVSSNVVQKKKVARILFFKINKLDVPSNVVQKKRVARILFFKIWSSQGILKVRDCTPMEAEEILTYIKSPRNGSVCYFSSKLDVPSNVVQKKRVARILFFKIRSSQEILKIRDGTYPFGGGGNFDIHKKPSKRIGLSSQGILKILARILFFKIRPYQEILKIRDGTSLEAEEILTYIRCPRNGSVCYFSSKLDVSINVVQKKKVAQILFFKIKSSQGILKIHVPSNVVQKKRVARILFFKIWSSQGILKVRDCTPMEAEEILTYIKSPRNGSVCYFSSKLDVPSNVVQKKRVARILFFKIRSSQEILKIRDGTYPFGGGGNFDIHKKPSKRIVMPYQEILKIRDGTSLEAEEILTYIRCPRNGSVCYFSSKLDVSINVVQKKKVAQILFFKIKCGGNFDIHKSPRNGSVCYFSSKLDVPSNVVQKKRVARILFYKIRPSQEILKIRDGTPLEAEEILTYIKIPRNGSVCYFSTKLDVSSNVVQKKKVARILFFKIRSSQGILKIRDGAPMEKF
ncbi:hypothetical protein OROHE_011262 [Orobanche hederae]